MPTVQSFAPAIRERDLSSAGMYMQWLHTRSHSHRSSPAAVGRWSPQFRRSPCRSVAESSFRRSSPLAAVRSDQKSQKRFIHHKQRGRLRYFITIAHPTITHGNAADTRSSSAASIKVCVPPPEAPVQPIRSVSIAGSEQIQSKDRMETHVKRLQSERDLSIARMYIQIREHRHVPHRRDEPPLSLCDHK